MKIFLICLNHVELAVITYVVYLKNQTIPPVSSVYLSKTCLPNSVKLFFSHHFVLIFKSLNPK